MFTLVLIKDHVNIDPNTFEVFDKPREHLHINKQELVQLASNNSGGVEQRVTKRKHTEEELKSLMAQEAQEEKEITQWALDREEEGEEEDRERMELARKIWIAKSAQTFEHAVMNWLHGKYAGKVLPDVGLCICVYAITETGSTHIYPIGGAIHCQVVFQLVVFRPVLGEVLVGTVQRCDRNLGIRVNMNFFRDVWIPPHLLQEQSEFDEEEGVWTWHFGEHELPMDIGEKIRFRVHSILFDTHQSSAPPFMGKEEQQAAAMAKTAAMSSRNDDADAEDEDIDADSDDEKGEGDKLRNTIERTQNLLIGDRARAPFEVIGRVNEDGLGMLEWWTGAGEEEEEEELDVGEGGGGEVQ